MDGKPNKYYQGKMRISKITFAALAIAAVSSLAVTAKNEAKTAYIFGFASSFNDSTVYITNLQKLDSTYFSNKGKFLVNRENYSYQLRDYLEQQGCGNRTCIVMFDTKQKNAQKKWAKLYDRYTKKPKAKKTKNGQQKDEAPTPYIVKRIDNSQFSFKAIEPND